MWVIVYALQADTKYTDEWNMQVIFERMHVPPYFHFQLNSLVFDFECSGKASLSFASQNPRRGDMLYSYNVFFLL